MDWNVEEKMPRYDDIREFQVWMGCGNTRKVRRAGNHSMVVSPGTLMFTDCTHPMQNIICDEQSIKGWRYSPSPSYAGTDMNRTEALIKLLRLGPLEPLHARAICGWPVDEFQRVLDAAVAEGKVRLVPLYNQYATRLEAT